ncbi:hypothetical protein [Viridibacillus arvi]|uniref:hypothetical protein n=1 Tax=Viridibacillus arvi TaxID=263475 RepID=UPI0034CE8170
MKVVNRFKDLDGNSIERSPIDYPYSYDEFVIWVSDYQKGNSENVYSDRLFQWDPKKFNDCCIKIWGNTRQYFNNRNPKEIEKFLSMYLDSPIKLTAITECCNRYSGYPYWSFYFNKLSENLVTNNN